MDNDSIYSEIPCGNCQEPTTIDHSGDVIQPCRNPDCQSPEMVKGVKWNVKINHGNHGEVT